MTTFGGMIHSLRASRGMTLEQVAKRCGTHKGYISSIERGKVAPPSTKLVVRLSRVFGVDAQELAIQAWVDKAPKMIRGVVQERCCI